jgi:hypothetical protein
MIKPAGANTAKAINASTFSQYHMNLSPLTAKQPNAGVGDQREAAGKQYDEKNEHRNQWVTHSPPPNGDD